MHVPTFLDALSPVELALIHGRGRIRSLSRGEVLFCEGDRRARPAVILDGFVRLERNAADGSRAVLGLRGPGEVTGELPCLDGAGQPIEANALTQARVLAIPATVLEEIVSTNATACASIAEGLVQQLRWLYEACNDSMNGVARARVAGRLLDIADIVGEVKDGAIEMTTPISQADVAGMSGVCRESATRVIADLKRQGAVTYSGRRLRILRPDVLERIRCAGRGAGPFRSRPEAGSRRSPAPPGA